MKLLCRRRGCFSFIPQSAEKCVYGANPPVCSGETWKPHKAPLCSPAGAFGRFAPGRAETEIQEVVLGNDGILETERKDRKGLRSEGGTRSVSNRTRAPQHAAPLCEAIGVVLASVRYFLHLEEDVRFVLRRVLRHPELTN